MTDVKHVSASRVEHALHRIAEKRPGVYARNDGLGGGCVNTEFVDGERVPSCIVGTFFVEELGIDVNEVPPTGVYTHLINTFKEKGWTFDRMAIALLGIAQKMQDTRMISWESIAECIGEIEVVVEDYARDLAVDMEMEFEPK
jgi:hypothetical protein